MTHNRVFADLPRSARDHTQQPLPAELRPLMSRMISMYRPLQVWLFGSRARKKFNLQSDWDLLTIVADDAPEELLDPCSAGGCNAKVVCTRISSVHGSKSSLRTLASPILLCERSN